MSYVAQLSRQVARQLLVPAARQQLRGGAQAARAPAQLRLASSFYGADGGIPFAHMPFSVGSKYTVTLSFALYGALGFWPPSFILWYSMAKPAL